jgi:hypothetical protein
VDEDALVDKLREIECKVARNDAVGDEACRAELAAWRQREADQEFRLSVPTPIAQRVLLGWCHRYGLVPYRIPRQRQTTVCVRVPRGFMQEVMWPRFEASARLMEQAVTEATRRVVERWSGASLARHEPDAEQGELFDEA